MTDVLCLLDARFDYGHEGRAMEKEYGKLTEGQFMRLIQQLPEFRREAKGMQAALRSASQQKLREILGEGVWWSPVYELSLSEGLALLVYGLGKVDRLKEALQLPDPHEALLTDLENNGEVIWGSEPEGAFTTAQIIGLATALQRNVFSIMVYKQSLSSLVAKARDDKEDDALLNAIRIDRTVMSCPTGAMRISKAELIGDKHFFIRLKSALKGPSKKHMEAYQDLRYSLAVLRELGFDEMSDAQLEHLLVDVLKVYSPSFTARKNLRKQYYESKKIKTL